MEILSTVPWYGAKYQICEKIAAHYKKDGVTTLIDGCGGSGKMIVNAPYFDKMVYNDYDATLYCLFSCIKSKELFLDFCDCIYKLKYSAELFRKAKQHIDEYSHNPQKYDLNDKSTMLGLAINKFIVICQSYNATQSSYRKPNVDTLVTYYNRLLSLVDVHYRMQENHIEVWNRDVFDLLDMCIHDKRKDVLFALDVPYLYGDDEERKKGGAYGKFDWPKKMHEKLLRIVKSEKNVPILICGYKSNLYDEELMYSDSPWSEIPMAEVAKSSSSRQGMKPKAIEMIWRNY